MQQIVQAYAAQTHLVQSLIGFVVLALVALAANFLLKHVFLRLAAPFLDRRTMTSDKAATRLATSVPALIIAEGVRLVPHLPPELEEVIRNIGMACAVIAIAAALSKALDYLNEVYMRHPESRARPIKGYVQVAKIVVYCAALILAIAVLIEQSPLLLLSGLGAIAAVLMLVFKDTILSLVASVQLSSNDMLRVGDWITMPQFNADGDVIDIALHTVKVQNFDKTIATIPTYSLISQSYRNWRGMRNVGARRIKRAINLDQNAIRFLTDDEVQDLRKFRLLDDYLATKDAQLKEWNARVLAGEANPVNAKRLTNIGTLRAYVIAYLKSLDQLDKSQTLMVRQLQPTPQGLPLEVYCFAATVVWPEYEGIQADIFDHLLAILPEFGLRVFQQPSGLDLKALQEGSPAASARQ